MVLGGWSCVLLVWGRSGNHRQGRQAPPRCRSRLLGRAGAGRRTAPVGNGMPVLRRVDGKGPRTALGVCVPAARGRKCLASVMHLAGRSQTPRTGASSGLARRPSLHAPTMATALARWTRFGQWHAGRHGHGSGCWSLTLLARRDARPASTTSLATTPAALATALAGGPWRLRLNPGPTKVGVQTGSSA